MSNHKKLFSLVLAFVLALSLGVPAFAAVGDTGFSDVDAGVRPALSTRISNLDDYDVIFIGYPIWWDETPAMITTFLAENDLRGKIVAPFCTSSYSPITNSLHVFRELASGATVVDGLTANSESAVRPWVDQVLSRAGK